MRSSSGLQEYQRSQDLHKDQLVEKSAASPGRGRGRGRGRLAFQAPSCDVRGLGRVVSLDLVKIDPTWLVVDKMTWNLWEGGEVKNMVWRRICWKKSIGAFPAACTQR